jgi:flagellar biosynthesis chaperone FliJ
MINEIYLIRALNIRKKYIQIVSSLSNYDNYILDLSKAIDDTQVKLDETIELIDDQKIDSATVAKEKFLTILLELETEMSNTEKYMNSFDEEVEKLRQEEIQLYKELKENYSNMSENDLKKEVHNYLSKFNLS